MWYDDSHGKEMIKPKEECWREREKEKDKDRDIESKEQERTAETSGES